MSIRYISATDLKNNTSEILNTVYYQKIEYFITRHGKVIAKIAPFEEKKKPKLAG